MSQTLYRKYRPQRFDELIGQNHIKITLQNEILTGQITHAYLFSGPRGIGKTTVARLLAKALNCTQRQEEEYEACGQCLSCTEILQGKSLDLIEIDAASHTGVDNVRENIIENVRFTPYRDKYKIFIIDEVHMLSISAFNALLKTLEEPPEHVVFVLCTTELYKLPETIISRCQRFDFKKVDLKILADYLVRISNREKIKVAQEVINKIATISGGFVRDGLSLLGQVLSLGKKEIKTQDAEAILPRSDYQSVAELIAALIQRNAKGGVELINNLVDQGVDLEQFTLDLIDYLRHLALIKLKVSDTSYLEVDNKIYEQSEGIELAEISQMINVFISKLSAVKNAEISQLPLEMGIIELTSRGGRLSADESQWAVDKVNTEKLKHQSIENTGTSKHRNTGTAAKIELPENSKKRQIENKEIKKDENTGEVADVGGTTPLIEQPGAAISLAEIKAKWPEIVKSSKNVNHSVAMALRTAEPTDLNNNNLELSFAHNFYCEQFKEVKSRSLIERVLKNMLGCDLIVKCVEMSAGKKAEILQSRQENQNNNNKVLDNLAQEFGGKLVE